MSTIKLLSKDYDLSKESDIELVHTMRDVCETYYKCYHEISTETNTAWECVVNVAIALVQRRGYSCIPVDLLEQEEREKIRKVSTEDIDDAFLIDALRDRGYAFHITVKPNVAHLDLEERAFRVFDND